MDFSKIDTNKKSLNALLGAFGKTRFAKSDFTDETEWILTKDKDGNGYAKIRFIPSPDGELFIEVRSHGFKIKESWYIENCPKTLDWDNPCPSCEHANDLKGDREWDKLSKGDQSLIRPIFAKTSYWANILVEKDPANPENEGKVFKFRFGKKILEKIYNRAIDDPLDETKGINVFDPIDGASFKLKSKKVQSYINYDDSSFDAPSQLCDGDSDKIDQLILSGIKIGELRSPANFKSYDDLKKKLMKLLGTTTVDAASTAVDESIPDSKEEEKYDERVEDTSTDSGEEDDAYNYFKDLADGEDVPF